VLCGARGAFVTLPNRGEATVQGTRKENGEKGECKRGKERAQVGFWLYCLCLLRLVVGNWGFVALCCTVRRVVA